MARMTIDGYHVKGAPAERTVAIRPEVHTIAGPGESWWNSIGVYVVLPLGVLLLAWLILGQAGCGIHRNPGFVQATPVAQAPVQRHHPPVNITVRVPPQAPPVQAPILGPSWLSCRDALIRQGIDPTGRCK